MSFYTKVFRSAPCTVFFLKQLHGSSFAKVFIDLNAFTIAKETVVYIHRKK